MVASVDSSAVVRAEIGSTRTSSTLQSRHTKGLERTHADDLTSHTHRHKHRLCFYPETMLLEVSTPKTARSATKVGTAESVAMS